MTLIWSGFSGTGCFALAGSFVEPRRIAHAHDHALGAEESGDDLPPGLGASVVDESMALTGQLGGRRPDCLRAG